jgi:hypothetical protein
MISQYFPFHYTNGTPVSFGTFFKALLYILSTMILKFRLNFDNFPTNSAHHVALDTIKATCFYEESVFSQNIGIRPPLTEQEQI